MTDAMKNQEILPSLKDKSSKKGVKK